MEQQMWECFNAFKENGKIYVFGDIISDEQYNKISDKNKKWFVKKLSD